MGFVGFRWSPGDFVRAREVRGLRHRLGEGWKELIDWRGLLLLARDEASVEMLPHGMGVVFGSRFGEGPDASPPCDQCVDPVPGWIERRWGSYVAVLVDRGYDLVRVLRDPVGARACYLADLDKLHVFFSDAEAFVALKPDIAPDLDFVRSFLTYPPYRGRRTGLAGVAELAPGSYALFPRHGRTVETAWTPTSAATKPFFDFNEGKLALRAAAETSVRAQTANVSKVALRLSGGFDSSAMLGLLKTGSDAEIVCVNEYWEGAVEGDEREHARFVADYHGVDIQTLRFDPAAVRYERLLAAPLTARPTLSALGFANSEVASFYRHLNCGLITSGQGGDHLFHRSRTVWIAADAFYDRLPFGSLLDIAIATSRLTRRSVWAVFSAIARMTLPGGIRVDPRADFVAGLQLVGAGDVAPEDHAWLADIGRAPPARAARVRQLLDALSYFDDDVLPAIAPTHPLFLSQPVVEACLRIPPYVMTADGKERALARAAFADLVPEGVFRRTTKGETTRYFAAVLSANAEWIKSVLIDGRLVQSGIVEASVMRDLFKSGWLQNGVVTGAVYTLIASECWLRNLERARLGAINAQAEMQPPAA